MSASCASLFCLALSSASSYWLPSFINFIRFIRKKHIIGLMDYDGIQISEDKDKALYNAKVSKA